MMAILEIGCGQNVPTMRQESMDYLKGIRKSKLIRINPVAPLFQGSDDVLRKKVIPIMETGLQAITDIEKALLKKL